MSTDKSESPAESPAEDKPQESPQGGEQGGGGEETPPKEETKEKEKSESPPPSKKEKRSDSRGRKVSLKEAKIGFVGAGKLAESVIKGLITYAGIDPSKIHVAAPSARNLEKAKSLGCHVTKRNYDIFGRYDCDIVFLAFHGSVIRHCFKMGGSRPAPFTTNYIPNMKHPLYVMSLVSGWSLKDIKKCMLNPDHPDKYMLEMHRVMLNTACAHGTGMGAIDCDPDGKKCSSIVRELLTSIAKIEYVPEPQMDAACAMGGAGLAFAYYFLGATADGAFRMGMGRDMTTKLAAKTAQAAAQTVLESGKHPGELRDSCCAPSGAAIYGLHVLDKADCASGISSAVEAAHKRNADMAKGKSD